MDQKTQKTIKTIFIIRICLWIIAAGGTLYWMIWSFKLYGMGIYDVYDYAKYFRPIFYRGLLISVVSICISLILRSISDKIKKDHRGY